MSCRVGIIHSKASKQKLNTKSPHNQNLLQSVSMHIYRIRIIYIFEGQGYTLHKKVLYEDNESVIKMQKDGRYSCAGNSRHISISFFLLRIVCIRRSLVSSTATHRQCSPTSSINHCMGHFFWRIREVIMGWSHVDILRDYIPPPQKERVEYHASGDKPETSQKATYVQVITGDLIGKIHGTE